MNIENLSNEQLIAQANAFLAPYHNGIAEGEKRERERIIKLIEENLEYLPYEGIGHTNLKRILRIETLIAFIKGELN
jgi:hypothetical protein